MKQLKNIKVKLDANVLSHEKLTISLSEVEVKTTEDNKQRTRKVRGIKYGCDGSKVST